MKELHEYSDFFEYAERITWIKRNVSEPGLSCADF